MCEFLWVDQLQLNRAKPDENQLAQHIAVGHGLTIDAQWIIGSTIAKNELFTLHADFKLTIRHVRAIDHQMVACAAADGYAGFHQPYGAVPVFRSEEHTSELQSLGH